MATRPAYRSQLLQLTAGALLLVTTSACGPAATPAAAPLPAPVAPVVEPTVEPVDPVDAALIQEYWSDRQQAWSSGLSSGVAFLVDHLHPGLAYTAEECTTAWFGSQPLTSFVEHSTLDVDSLQRDADWTMATGPLQDDPLDGDVYTMQVALRYDGAAAAWGGRDTETHLEVANGRVRNFLRCDVPLITVSSVEAPTPTATPTVTPSPTATTPTLPPPWTLPTGQPTRKPSSPSPSPTPTQPGPSPTPSPSPTPTPTPTEEPLDPDLDFCSGDRAGDYSVCPEDALAS